MSHLSIRDALLLWVFIVVLIIVVVAVVAGLIMHISVMREVRKVPKVPMLLCDKHGMYPDKEAFYIEVPGTESGRFPICPYCQHERINQFNKSVQS